MLDILEGKNGNTPIPIREEIGGHSSVWVIRAQYENCGSYSAPYPSEFNKKNLVVDDSQRVILPYEHMQVKEEKEAEVARKREDSKKELKMHYGSLKFKPKKAVALESYMSDNIKG